MPSLTAQLFDPNSQSSPRVFFPAHKDKILAQKLLLPTVLPQARQYTVSAQGSSPREEAMNLV